MAMSPILREIFERSGGKFLEADDDSPSFGEACDSWRAYQQKEVARLEAELKVARLEAALSNARRDLEMTDEELKDYMGLDDEDA